MYMLLNRTKKLKMISTTNFNIKVINYYFPLKDYLLGSIFKSNKIIDQKNL